MISANIGPMIGKNQTRISHRGKESSGSVACDMNGCPYCRKEPYDGQDCQLQNADAKCLKNVYIICLIICD